MPEIEEYDVFNDHLCPRCKDEDASIDGGRVCLKCGYIDGECVGCGHTNTNMTVWMSDNPFYENVPNKVVPTPQERTSLERNVHNDDLTGYYFFGPPYIPVQEEGENLYICESSCFSFKCERCNMDSSIHCD